MPISFIIKRLFMKKRVLLAVALLMSLTMTSQAQLLRFGVKGGINTTKMSFKNVGANFKSSNRVGVFVGPMVEAKLPIIGLGVDGAFMLSYKDARVKQYGDDSFVKNKTVTEIGIDIPVNLKYTIGLSRIASIYFAAGPDFFFNVGKNPKFKDLKFSKKTAQVGINLGAGATFLNHYQLGLAYNVPLTKSAEFVDVNNIKQSYKSKSWQLSFAYLF